MEKEKEIKKKNSEVKNKNKKCNCHEECECESNCTCKENDKCSDECSCGSNDFIELNDKYIRLQAEFQNFKTRTANEVTNMLKYEGASIILEILGIVDDFERAIKMDDNDLSDEVSKFLSGFKMIYTNLMNILEKLEVKVIDVEGKEFDPNISEAILTEHDEAKPENVVLEVLQKGYTYHDKIIRRAMVKVNK